MDYVKYLNSLDEIALPSGSGPAPDGWKAEKIFKELKEDGKQTVQELQKLQQLITICINMFDKTISKARSHNWPSTILLKSTGDEFDRLNKAIKDAYAFPNGCKDIADSCKQLAANEKDWNAFTGRKTNTN